MGGGIIGLEMGTVYDALGSEVEGLKCLTKSFQRQIKMWWAFIPKQVEKNSANA